MPSAVTTYTRPCEAAHDVGIASSGRPARMGEPSPSLVALRTAPVAGSSATCHASSLLFFLARMPATWTAPPYRRGVPNSPTPSARPGVFTPGPAVHRIGPPGSRTLTATTRSENAADGDSSSVVSEE